jgi:YaiO family outer membrane protein
MAVPRLDALAGLLLVSISAGTAGAQSVDFDVPACSARIGSGARDVSALEVRLESCPLDADAAWSYAQLLLSEGRVEQARVELIRTLDLAPSHGPARATLAELELRTGRFESLNSVATEGARYDPDAPEWPIYRALALTALGRRSQARDVLNTLLAREPGNPQARALRDRLDSSLRPWSSSFVMSMDRFSEGEPWQETSLAVARMTPVGPFAVHGSRAARLGQTDGQVLVEMQPRFGPTTHAQLSFSASERGSLYPNMGLSATIYHDLGRGFSASGGVQFLKFDDGPANVYSATVTQYFNKWMIGTGFLSVPGTGQSGATGFSGLFRRYFGSDGTGYAGVAFGHGVSRLEISSLAEVIRLTSNSIKGEVDAPVTAHLRFNVAVGTTLHTHAWGSLRQQSVVLGVGTIF